MAAWEIAQTCPGVEVPKILSRISDENSEYEYFLMQYVPGKTIWTLLLETVANPQGRLDLPDAPSAGNPIEQFYQARSRFPVHYQNDTEAEKAMIEHFFPISVERELPRPDTRVRDKLGRITLPYLEFFINEALEHTSVFGSDLVTHIFKVLRPFLEKSHNAGLYHRDLNVRNLMLGEDGKVYVIDYGKGTRTTSGEMDDSVYRTQEGDYDSDYDIMSIVRRYGPKKKTQAEIICEQAEAAKSGLDFQTLNTYAFALGLDPQKVETVVRGLRQRSTEKSFQSFFSAYVD